MLNKGCRKVRRPSLEKGVVAVVGARRCRATCAHHRARRARRDGGGGGEENNNNYVKPLNFSMRRPRSYDHDEKLCKHSLISYNILLLLFIISIHASKRVLYTPNNSIRG